MQCNLIISEHQIIRNAHTRLLSMQESTLLWHFSQSVATNLKGKVTLLESAFKSVKSDEWHLCAYACFVLFIYKQLQFIKKILLTTLYTFLLYFFLSLVQLEGTKVHTAKHFWGAFIYFYFSILKVPQKSHPAKQVLPVSGLHALGYGKKEELL